MRPLFPSAVDRYVETYQRGREEYNHFDGEGWNEKAKADVTAIVVRLFG